MAKYMLLYNGPATPAAEMDPDQVASVMGAWRTWMENCGAALTDMGQPTANGVAVVDDGTVGKATQINGYSFVEADSMDAAKTLVEGHPFLSEGSGRFSVEIHEVQPLPSM
jgi:hypothetical protein